MRQITGRDYAELVRCTPLYGMRRVERLPRSVVRRRDAARCAECGRLTGGRRYLQKVMDEGGKEMMVCAGCERVVMLRRVEEIARVRAAARRRMARMTRLGRIAETALGVVALAWLSGCAAGPAGPGYVRVVEAQEQVTRHSIRVERVMPGPGVCPVGQ